MNNNMFTVEQVAKMLDLHPRTIRRFIREEKLKARKVGGQWRISQQNLEPFIGEESLNERKNPQQPELVQKQIKGNISSKAKAYVSSVVDVFVENAEDAMRISNSIFAVMNCKDPLYGETRCDYVFYEDELKARFILWGKPLFISQLLGLIAEISE